MNKDDATYRFIYGLVASFLQSVDVGHSAIIAHGRHALLWGRKRLLQTSYNWWDTLTVEQTHACAYMNDFSQWKPHYHYERILFLYYYYITVHCGGDETTPLASVFGFTLLRMDRNVCRKSLVFSATIGHCRLQGGLTETRQDGVRASQSIRNRFTLLATCWHKGNGGGLEAMFTSIRRLWVTHFCPVHERFGNIWSVRKLYIPFCNKGFDKKHILLTL